MMSKKSAESGLESKFQNLHEFIKSARLNLSQIDWDYLAGGTETETTLKRNRLALDSIAFRPRVLRDMSEVDTTGSILGQSLRIPVFPAPIGSVEKFVEDGGAAVSRAAARFGVAHMLSSVCMPGLEEVAKAADNPKMFQLYVRGDDDFVDDHVRRAVDNGYFAFCITVDSAVYSRRERDIAKRFVKPWRTGGAEFQVAFNWDNVRRFKDVHDVPLILKGLATAEDAAMACEIGVDGIYVSNHGGRCLDHGLGSIAVLPEIVDAVQGRAEVYVDGGFLRGSDVLKALALGASAVGLGRLQCCGLAAAGEDGLVRVLELLENEMQLDMALLGLRRLDELDASYLSKAEPVGLPDVFSAFPLLNLEDEGY